MSLDEKRIIVDYFDVSRILNFSRFVNFRNKKSFFFDIPKKASITWEPILSFRDIGYTRYEELVIADIYDERDIFYLNSSGFNTYSENEYVNEFKKILRSRKKAILKSNHQLVFSNINRTDVINALCNLAIMRIRFENDASTSKKIIGALQIKPEQRIDNFAKIKSKVKTSFERIFPFLKNITIPDCCKIELRTNKRL